MSSHPDEKTIILRKPVEFAGRTYSELQLREPTLGEFADACKHEGVTSDIFLIAAVTGIEVQAVRKIGYRDAKEARDFLAVFINSPATGETPSPK
ncbi:phage tail assembly protein [Azospirillum brasilense]|uniref:Phage tail assembly protein n=1 Tax=Azospirillum brasilense TaxID=192 RepID=A0A4D8R9U9_AZOBR|nr:phage tail assembly protein [Azospirillum brasilense]QCO13992.1 phage tail assembly protein [Azospirillum brasilense]